MAVGLTSRQDRDAIKAWVEGQADRGKSKEVFDTLAGLPVGTGWVWAPDHDILERVKFPRIRTLDTSSTPKGGERRFEPKRLLGGDLDRLRQQMAVDHGPATVAKKIRVAAAATPSVPVADPRAVRDAEHRGQAQGFEDWQARRSRRRLSEGLAGHPIVGCRGEGAG